MSRSRHTHEARADYVLSTLLADKVAVVKMCYIFHVDASPVVSWVELLSALFLPARIAFDNTTNVLSQYGVEVHELAAVALSRRIVPTVAKLPETLGNSIQLRGCSVWRTLASIDRLQAYVRQRKCAQQYNRRRLLCYCCTTVAKG